MLEKDGYYKNEVLYFQGNNFHNPIPYNPSASTNYGSDGKTSGENMSDLGNEVIRLLKSKKRKIPNFFMISLLPITFFAFQIILPIIMSILKKKTFNSVEFKSKASNLLKNDCFSWYFILQSVNSDISIIWSFIQALLGIAIVIMLYSTLKQRFNVPEFKSQNIQLYILLACGIGNSIIEFANGVYSYLNGVDVLFEPEQSIVFFNTKVLLFFIVVALSIIFAITVISNVKLMRKGQLLNENEESWFGYKLIILNILLFFTLSYLSIVLQNKGYTLFFHNQLLENNAKYITEYFPYFIHLMVGILVLSYYFDLRYCYLSLSMNLEVDYLFEEDDNTKAEILE